MQERKKIVEEAVMRSSSSGSSGKQIKGTIFLAGVKINAISPNQTGHKDIRDADERQTKDANPPLPTYKRVIGC